MSSALLGILLIQVYWFNESLQRSKEQFNMQIQKVLDNVEKTVEEDEVLFFVNQMHSLEKEGRGDKSKELLSFGYYQKNNENNDITIYSNNIISEDLIVPPAFFDNKDTVRISNYSSKRVLEVYKGLTIDKAGIQKSAMPDISEKRSNDLKALDKVQFEIALKDIAATYPVQKRISVEKLRKLLDRELKILGIKAPFEFSIFSNGLSTKVKTENFEFCRDNTFGHPIFVDNDGKTTYQLMVTFPSKKKWLIQEILGISLLSILLTFIVVFSYLKTLKQLNNQRKISEIKTDFINNMTHEFKTPIATINLALDAIKNPKVIHDEEKVKRYVQMIREENKRMNAQVENVLRISKLEKNEIELVKESVDIHHLIQNAVQHLQLIANEREAVISLNLQAQRSFASANEDHMTNVIINLIDNALKYSPEKPIINISSVNEGNEIVIKVSDRGMGMTKIVQKRVFEKFYREHTGDIHNVKGHGLGLAYVQKIIDEHDGKVFVDSEKDKGSTFTIRLKVLSF
jgi:two-component system phosphate regulon sensor histidine kinase PhoR